MKTNAKAKISLKKATLVKLNDAQKKAIMGGAQADSSATTFGTGTSARRGCCIPPCW